VTHTAQQRRAPFRSAAQAAAAARQQSCSWGTYDGTDSRGRRRAPFSKTTTEDAAADARKREMLSATGHDLARNFVLTKSMIRRHLDFTTTFRFQAKTPDRGFNAYLEQWWTQKTKRESFDIAHRHPHRRGLRIAEACRVIEGDHGWLKVSGEKGEPDRGTVQQIESSRISINRGDLPSKDDPEHWVNAVHVDPDTGRALEYAISRRTGRTGMKLDRIVPASSMLMHSLYEFRTDQVRGVGAIAATLNWMKDTYEAFDYVNAKLKLGALFGVSIYSNTQEMQWTRGDGYEIDFGQRGPFLLELNEGDKAEILQSKTTSSEDNAYLGMLCLLCLKTLDIPYSLWDATKGKFHGNKSELITYQMACKDRIADLVDFQEEHADWRMNIGVADGDLELPSGKGLDFINYEFVPAGVPPWDSVKETRGSAMQIACGFSSPQREARLIDTDFEQNILETEAALKFAADHNVPLHYADVSAFAPEIATPPEAPDEE
jgi:capsid protein